MANNNAPYRSEGWMFFSSAKETTYLLHQIMSLEAQKRVCLRRVLYVQVWKRYFFPSGTVLAGPNFEGEALITVDLDFEASNFHLLDLFKHEIDKPAIRKRIENVVRDKQEAVVVITEIQEDILLKMGIDSPFGIACLGKVNTIYEND